MNPKNPYERYRAADQSKENDLCDLVGCDPREEAAIQSAPVPESPEARLEALALTEAELRRLATETVCPGCAERAAAEDERLRLYAEMDNFKKRLQREQAEQARYAAGNVLADLLPVLDNMELALQYSGNEICKPILMGVEMTHKILLDTLRRHGLEAIGQTGDVFDPLIHEAVGREEAPDLDPGLVSKLMQRGYKLGDRLLRPARVIVSA